MYAHQVIEDLRQGMISHEINHAYKACVVHCINSIMNAEKFNWGMIPKHTDNGIFMIHKGRLLFTENRGLYKIPFSSCWFDWEHESGDVSKQGALIQENDSTLTIFAFQFFKSIDRWVLSPSKYGLALINGVPGIAMEKLISEEDVGVDQGILTKIEKMLLLLNCKNIQTEKIKAPEALNKKRRKQGKQPIFDYHVLNVVVPSAKRGYQGKTEPLSHNRVHLCRGHFKEYTEEHPLFGKYTGLYWWQPHVRGQNKDGIVMKDYEVKTK